KCFPATAECSAKSWLSFPTKAKRPTSRDQMNHDAYAAWRLPQFRRYFAGNMILILGWQMQKVAIGWEIYERTHSAMALGYAGLVQFLPQVLFMLIAGHVTDAFNRKRVLMAALACNAMAGGGLALNSAKGGSIYVL